MDEQGTGVFFSHGFNLINHNALYRLPTLHQIKALDNVVKRHGVRNQIIDIDLAFHLPVDDFRNVGATPCAAECGAFPVAVRHELERSRSHLCARQRVVVCVADTRGLDFNEHFACFGPFQINGFNGERSARFPRDGSFSFHSKYSGVSITISVIVNELGCPVGLESGRDSAACSTGGGLHALVKKLGVFGYGVYRCCAKCSGR